MSSKYNQPQTSQVKRNHHENHHGETQRLRETDHHTMMLAMNGGLFKDMSGVNRRS